MNTYTYRRGSIFWALILIGIGGLFLYQNFNPAVHPWQVIAKFWPLLIIFWGLSKLIDFLQYRAHPETTPPSLFSGSEVILLLLILLLGTIVSKAVLHPWREWGQNLGIDMGNDFDSLFTNSYTYTRTLNQPVEAQPRLAIVNRRGDVEIQGADTASVNAVIKETVRADSDAEAKKVSDQLKLQVVQKNGQWVLDSNLDSLPSGGRNVRLDMTLRVPFATSAEVSSERGDVMAAGLKGEQNLTANHGDARVSKVEGLVRIHKSSGSTEANEIKGNVEIDGHGGDVTLSDVSGTAMVNGEFTGSIDFRNVAQSLRFTSSRTDLTVQQLTGRLNMEVGSLEASGVGGPFDISTREKDIELNGFDHAVKITDTNGDINLTAAAAPAHPVEVNSEKGEIQLTLPQNSSFQIDAVSRHGDVESDFQGPNLKVNREGDAPSIQGSYGRGGPTIRLSTAYGTIRLLQAGPRSAPEKPRSPNAPKAPPSPTRDQTSLHGAHRHLPA